MALLRHHTERITGDTQRTAINRIYALASSVGVIKGGWLKVEKVDWGEEAEKGGAEGAGMEKVRIKWAISDEFKQRDSSKY